MSSTIFPFLRTSSDFSPFHYVEDDYSNEKDYELSSEVLRFQEDQLQLRSFAQLLYVSQISERNSGSKTATKQFFKPKYK